MSFKIIFLYLSITILAILVNVTKNSPIEEYSSIEQLWMDFKLKNGKVYTSLEEELRFITLKIFKKFQYFLK